MIRRAATATLLLCCPILAQAQPKDCRAIPDATERLACFDAQAIAPRAIPAPPAKPPASATATDPLLAQARAKVVSLMRDPASAKFDGLTVRRAPDGTKAVCGRVNGKNAMGGYSGPQMFNFDGKYARFLIADAGPSNPTTFDRLVLGAALGEALQIHDKYCK